MKKELEFKEILVIGITFFLILFVLFFVLKDTYSIEMNLRNEVNGEIAIVCNDNTALPLDNLTCSISAANFNTEVSSFSAKLSLDSNLELQNIEKDSGWEGSAEGGIIDLYTDINKGEEFNLVSFTVKASDINSGVNTFISLQNIVISDENFVEHVLNDVVLSIRIKSTINSLDNLSIDNVDFNFEPEVLSYNLTTDLEEIMINAIPTSETAIINGDIGLKKLNFGVNTFNVIVISETGLERIYTLNITRPERLSFSDEIIVDENNMILKFDNSNFKFNDILSKINTTGNISISNIQGNNVTNDDYIGSGYNLTIELSTKSYNYRIVILGDTNGDGQLTVADVSKMFQHYRGTYTMDDIYVLAGDVQKDDEIKLTDVAKLFQYIRGNIDSLK